MFQWKCFGNDENFRPANVYCRSRHTKKLVFYIYMHLSLKFSLPHLHILPDIELIVHNVNNQFERTVAAQTQRQVGAGKY